MARKLHVGWYQSKPLNHPVLRVPVNRNGEYSIPIDTAPGTLVFDQTGAYLESVPTRVQMVAKN